MTNWPFSVNCKCTNGGFFPRTRTETESVCVDVVINIRKTEAKVFFLAFSMLWAIFFCPCIAGGQGTAFTYQGSLVRDGLPANGRYDFTFTLYGSSTGSNIVAGPQINAGRVVSNGVFTASVDFGAGIFTGGSYWVEVAVRTNGGGSLTTLVPRQLLTPTPYAIYAPSAGAASTATSAASLTGNVAASQISGTISAGQLPSSVLTNGASGVNISGTFSGNGSGITNVDARSLMTVPFYAEKVISSTPALGYNSWFYYGIGVSEAAMSNLFQMALTNGMKAAGYKYFVVDQGWTAYYPDNWSSNTPYATGQTVWHNGIAWLATVNNTNVVPGPQTNTWVVNGFAGRTTNGTPIIGTNFPHGIAYLANMAHTNGFLLGLYTPGGEWYNGFVGSGGTNAQADGLTYASWGVDYVKFDSDLDSSVVLIKAMLTSGRPVWFSPTMSSFDPFVAEEAASWRGSYFNADMLPGHWDIFLEHVDYAVDHAKFFGHGVWYNPDALDAGGISQNTKAEMATFAVLTTDILWDSVPPAGNYWSLFYMTNLEALAIDQDPGGFVGTLVSTNASGLGRVYAKPLGSAYGDKKAVCVLNRSTNSTQTITVNWADIGLPANSVAVVRDVFQQANLGYYTNSYSVTLAAQDSRLLTITKGNAPFFNIGTNYISDLGYLDGWTNSSVAGWPLGLGQQALPSRDVFYSGAPLTLAGKTYKKGISMIANSRIQFALGGLASRFHSDIGIDSYFYGLSSANFVVSLDGVVLFNSGNMGNNTVQTVDVDVTGGQILTLDITNNASLINNVGDWAGAYILYNPTMAALQFGDGSVLSNVIASPLQSRTTASPPPFTTNNIDFAQSVQDVNVAGGLTMGFANLVSGAANRVATEEVFLYSGLGGATLTWTPPPSGQLNWENETGNAVMPTNLPPCTVAHVKFTTDVTGGITNVIGHALFSSYTPYIDSNAQQFFNAAGKLAASESNAVNNLVIGLKNAGLWTWDCIYPFVGGTAGSCSWNLANPGKYRVNWTLGSSSFDSTGWLSDGVTSYGDTGFNPSVGSLNYSPSSATLFVYNGTAHPNYSISRYSFVGATGNNIKAVLTMDNSNRLSVLGFNNSDTCCPFELGVSSFAGPLFVTATPSNSTLIYGNGNSRTESDPTTGVPNATFYLGAENAGGFAAPIQARFKLVMIGAGLNSSQTTALTNLVSQFEQTLGRQ